MSTKFTTAHHNLFRSTANRQLLPIISLTVSYSASTSWPRLHHSGVLCSPSRSPALLLPKQQQVESLSFCRAYFVAVSLFWVHTGLSVVDHASPPCELPFCSRLRRVAVIVRHIIRASQMCFFKTLLKVLLGQNKSNLNT